MVARATPRLQLAQWSDGAGEYDLNGHRECRLGLGSCHKGAQAYRPAPQQLDCVVILVGGGLSRRASRNRLRACQVVECGRERLGMNPFQALTPAALRDASDASARKSRWV